MHKIPFSPPDITEAEIQEVCEALRSGWITTGPKTKEFERQIAAYCGTDKAVCLNSATACLEMTLRILGIGPGDEVITSAYTYTASASPVCHVGADKFVEQKEDKSWAAEHVVGVGKSFGSDVPEEVRKEIIDGLRANFEGECSEVGMYLAMARVAHREGYPEIGLYWEKAGLEEAEHAAKFAELLGEVITDSTKKNLEMRVDAENGATAGKFELAKLAKKYNLDAIHDTVHEMARDEARHGKAFEGLLNRYFGK